MEENMKKLEDLILLKNFMIERKNKKGKQIEELWDIDKIKEQLIKIKKNDERLFNILMEKTITFSSFQLYVHDDFLNPRGNRTLVYDIPDFKCLVDVLIKDYSFVEGMAERKPNKSILLRMYPEAESIIKDFVVLTKSDIPHKKIIYIVDPKSNKTIYGRLITK